jgi:GT2 family glycosyltransferase
MTTATEEFTPTGRRVLAPPPAHRLEAASLPSFSVIVAAYDAAQTVCATVRSALEQTHPPLEVIVCDDASPADERGALAPYLDQIVYIRHERNQGTGGAKRTAAEAARGDWIVAVDADDAMLPERLAALAELAVMRPDLDIINTESNIEVDGRVVRHAYQADWPFPVTGQREEILRRCFVLGGAVRRTRLEAVGGFSGVRPLMEDWELYGRLLLTGSQAGLVDEPLLSYRISEGQISTSWSSALHSGELAALERLRENPALRSHERPILDGSIANTQQLLAAATAREALLAGNSDARRRSLAVMRERGAPLWTRVKAAGSAAAPGVAGRLLRRRAARVWQGSAGVRVRR